MLADGYVELSKNANNYLSEDKVKRFMEIID